MKSYITDRVGYHPMILTQSKTKEGKKVARLVTGHGKGIEKGNFLYFLENGSYIKTEVQEIEYRDAAGNWSNPELAKNLHFTAKVIELGKESPKEMHNTLSVFNSPEVNKQLSKALKS